MSYRHAVISASVWTLLQTLVERGIQAVTFLVVAHLVGPTEFGVAAIAIAPAMIFIASVQGISQLVVKMSIQTNEKLDNVFFFSCCVSIFIAVVMGAACLLLITLIHQPRLAALIISASIAPVVSSLGMVSEGLLARLFEFRLLAIRRMCGLMAAAPLCIFLAIMGAGAWSMVINLVTSSVVSTVTAVLVAHWRPSWKVQWATLLVTFKEALELVYIQTVGQATTRLSDIVVGVVAGPAATGVFRLGRTLIDLITSLVYTPMSSVLLSLFARINDSPDRLRDALFKVVCLSTCVLSIAVLAIMSVFRSIFILAPFSWNSLEATVRLLLLSLSTVGVTNACLTANIATSRTRVNLSLLSVDTIICTSAVAVGAFYGPVGAAIAFLTRSVALAILVCIDTFTFLRLPSAQVKLLLALMGSFLSGVIILMYLDIKVDPAAIMMRVSIGTLVVFLYASICAFQFRNFLRPIWQSSRGTYRVSQNKNDDFWESGIIIVQNYYTPYRTSMFEALARRGLDLTVVYMQRHTDESRRWSYCQPSAFAVRHCSYIRIRPFVFAIPPRSLIWGGQQKTAIIVDNNPTNISSLLFIAIYKLKGLRTLLWVEHIPDVTKPRSRYMYQHAMSRVLLRIVDGALAFSEMSRVYITQRAPSTHIFSCKQSVPRPTVDVLAPRAASGVRIIGYVGSAEPRKNLDALIDAFLSVSTVGMSLHIAGVERESNDARVIYHGFLHGEKLDEFYKSIDMLMLPSKVDPWGMVTNEAMHRGCLCAVSSSCGSAEVVRLVADWLVFEPSRRGIAQCIKTAAALSGSAIYDLSRKTQEAINLYSEEEAVSSFIAALSQSTKSS